MGDSVAQTERLPNVPIKYDNFVLRYYIRLSIVCFVWKPNELRAEIQLSFVFVIFFFGFSFGFPLVASVCFVSNIFHVYFCHLFSEYISLNSFHFISILYYSAIIQSAFAALQFCLLFFDYLHCSLCILLFYLCASTNLINYYLFWCISYLFAIFSVVFHAA